MLEYLLRRPGFRDHAAVDKQDAVRDFLRKAHLVGHDHAGHAAFRKALNDLQNALDHLGIEGRGRFVEKHDLRLHGQGSYVRQPLLLTARELSRVFKRLIGEPDSLKKGESLCFSLRLRVFFGHHRSNGDVVDHLQMGKDIELLKNHTDPLPVQVQIGAFFIQFRPFEQHLAARGGLEQIQAAQEGRFSAAGGADDAHDLAPKYFFTDAFQNLELSEVFFQIDRFNQGYSVLSH